MSVRGRGARDLTATCPRAARAQRRLSSGPQRNCQCQGRACALSSAHFATARPSPSRHVWRRAPAAFGDLPLVLEKKLYYSLVMNNMVNLCYGTATCRYLPIHYIIIVLQNCKTCIGLYKPSQLPMACGCCDAQVNVSYKVENR